MLMKPQAKISETTFPAAAYLRCPPASAGIPCASSSHGARPGGDSLKGEPCA